MKTLIDHLIEHTIMLDSHAEPVYGSDQANLFYPFRFPTVNLELCSTRMLNEAADDIRQEKGFPRIYDGEHDGYYNFYIGLNGFTHTKLDTSITFTVNSEGMDDDGACYTISLDEDLQTAVFDHLNKMCKTAFNKSCDELLAEARDEMVNTPNVATWIKKKWDGPYVECSFCHYTQAIESDICPSCKSVMHSE